MPHATSQVILAVSYTLIYNYKFVIIIYNEMNASYDINHQPPNKPLCMPPSHQPVSIHHNKATSTRFCICACHTPYPTFYIYYNLSTSHVAWLIFISPTHPFTPFHRHLFTSSNSYPYSCIPPKIKKEKEIKNKESSI